MASKMNRQALLPFVVVTGAVMVAAGRIGVATDVT
jgi:hypothetical protein